MILLAIIFLYVDGIAAFPPANAPVIGIFMMRIFARAVAVEGKVIPTADVTFLVAHIWEETLVLAIVLMLVIVFLYGFNVVLFRTRAGAEE